MNHRLDRVQTCQRHIWRLDTAPLEAQRARLVAQRDQVTARLELARLTLDRQRALRGQGHATEQRLDEARLSADTLAAELAEVAAAIRALDIDLEKTVIRAPFDGVAGARLIDEGAVVAAGTAVIDLLETGRPMARIGVAPEAAETLSPGAAAVLRVGGREVPARVAALRPDLATATRTVTALFDIDTPAGAVGDTAELAVTRTVAAPGAWLPLAALVEGRRGLWSVFVVTDGGVIARESVEVLHVADGRAYVRGTLAPGARVVAGGAHRVVPGQPVQIAQAE